MYTFALTIHLISAILFIGTVYFRTFAILPYAKKEEFMKKAYELSGKRGRFLAYFFVTTLLLSGLYLGYQKIIIHSTTTLLNIKMTLGLILITIFYFAQKIVPKYKHIPNFGLYFHRGMFTCMIIVVILAKFKYFY